MHESNVVPQPGTDRGRICQPVLCSSGAIPHLDTVTCGGVDDRETVLVGAIVPDKYSRAAAERRFLHELRHGHALVTTRRLDLDDHVTGLDDEILPEVGSGEPNYWGVQDLHGLIWEWVADFNTALVTGESRGDTGLERSLFCGAGSLGAPERDNYPAFMRFGFRGSLKANYTVHNLGFRCAKSP